MPGAPLTRLRQPSALPPDGGPDVALPLSFIGRAGGALRRVSLVEPPVQRPDGQPQASDLWVSPSLHALYGTASLVPLHMALQGLLVRLESLAGGDGAALHPMLRVLVKGRFAHAYATTSDFLHLTAPWGTDIGTEDGIGTGARTVDAEAGEGWLIVDVQQGFQHGRPVPALIAGLARLAEMPVAARRSEGLHGDAQALLLQGARHLLQHALHGDPAMEVPPAAAALASRFGERPLVRWLLTDHPLPAAVPPARRGAGMLRKGFRAVVGAPCVQRPEPGYRSSTLRT